MSDHTPGPWTLETNGACWNLRSPDRVNHFLILIGMTHNYPGELEANAHLCAAGPAMLKACIQARDTLLETTAVPVEYLDKAIAKARGEA